MSVKAHVTFLGQNRELGHKVSLFNLEDTLGPLSLPGA